MITTVGACVLAAIAGMATCSNVLVNADMTLTDGMGAPLGWSAFNWNGSSLTARSCGDEAVAITSHNANQGFYRQSPIRLQSGGRYRFSVDVKSALPAGAGFSLICWPKPWKKDVKVPLPADTHGTWQRVTWEGAIPESDNPDDYSIGFCGKGTTNGAATVEIRNYLVEPLTCEAASAVRRVDVSAMKPLTARIVPIDPLLGQVRAKNAEMTFYWPAVPSCGVTNCTLSGVLLHNGVAPGKRAQAKFDGRGRAKLVYGVIGTHCRYLIGVHVTDPAGRVLATNDYWLVGRPEPPEGPQGRRLNNFVTELFQGKLQNGEMKFFRPTDGWVWLSFENCTRAATGYLDDDAVPAVQAYPEEKTLEAMRYVTAGWHALSVKGAAEGGRLRIHAVKRVGMPVYSTRGGACDFKGPWYKFTFPFARRFLLNAMNTGGMEQFIVNPHDATLAYYMSRGLAPLGQRSIHFYHPARGDETSLGKLLNGGSWLNGWDCTIDENVIGDTRANHVAMSETLWRMVHDRPRQSLSVYWGDATSFAFDDPAGHTAELSAIFNSGYGRGCSLPEVYAPALARPEDTDRWIDLFAEQVRTAGELVPGGKDHTCFHLSPFINMGSWTDEPCPETDIKAHYSRLMRIFATDPRFAANAGISSGAARACEEELRRWHARCQRYYAIEGGTDDLARRYGFAWNPGIVKNPDFAEGLTNWTARPAVKDGVRGVTLPKFGSKIQHRMKVPKGVGDTLAEFTAAAEGPNILEQRLTGLVPGRFYMLRYCVVNRANAEKRQAERPPKAFSARVDGAQEVPGLAYEHVVPSGDGEIAGRECTYVFLSRTVFKAVSREARLVFSDRAADGASVPPGTRQVLNYVVLRPYYCESPDEPYEIAKLLGLKK